PDLVPELLIRLPWFPLPHCAPPPLRVSYLYRSAAASDEKPDPTPSAAELCPNATVKYLRLVGCCLPPQSKPQPNLRLAKDFHRGEDEMKRTLFRWPPVLGLVLMLGFVASIALAGGADKVDPKKGPYNKGDKEAVPVVKPQTAGTKLDSAALARLID